MHVSKFIFCSIIRARALLTDKSEPGSTCLVHMHFEQIVMNLIGASLNASILLVTLLVILSPWLYHKTSHSRVESPYRIALSGFIAIHTLFILRTAIGSPPPNIFTYLDIPLTTPTQVIRRVAILRTAYPDRNGVKWNDDLEVKFPLAAPLETLIKRLGSFELRTLYVRFLHFSFST